MPPSVAQAGVGARAVDARRLRGAAGRCGAARCSTPRTVSSLKIALLRRFDQSRSCPPGSGSRSRAAAFGRLEARRVCSADEAPPTSAAPLACCWSWTAGVTARPATSSGSVVPAAAGAAGVSAAATVEAAGGEAADCEAPSAASGVAGGAAADAACCSLARPGQSARHRLLRRAHSSHEALRRPRLVPTTSFSMSFTTSPAACTQAQKLRTRERQDVSACAHFSGMVSSAYLAAQRAQRVRTRQSLRRSWHLPEKCAVVLAATHRCVRSSGVLHTLLKSSARVAVADRRGCAPMGRTL